MKLFQNYEFEKYVFIFLILFYVLGIAIVKDYGISWDESAQRMHGFINGNYYFNDSYSDIYCYCWISINAAK